MKVMFLGVGNLHRADDGVGPLIADRLLADKKFMQNDIHVQPHSGEGASLIHLWDGVDRLVVVDAMKSGAPLGSIHRFDVAAQTLHHGVFRYSSHLFGLAEAVEMSRMLGSLPKQMVIYGIEGQEFTFGAELSPDVAAALAPVEEAVRKELEGFLHA